MGCEDEGFRVVPRAGRVTVLGAVLLASIVIVLVGPRSPEDLQIHGTLAPVVFVALATLTSCLMFPFPVTAAAAGLLFGAALGTVITVVSTSLGAVAAFLIARHWIGALPKRFAGERVDRALAAVDRRGFVAVLYLRIIPGLPRGLLSYLLGLTRVTLPVYAVATVLGTVPRAFAYASLGTTSGLGDLTSTTNLVAIAALAILALVAPAVDAGIRVRARRSVEGSPIQLGPGCQPAVPYADRTPPAAQHDLGTSLVDEQRHD